MEMAQMNLVTKWSDANQNRQSGRKARRQTRQLVGRRACRQSESETDGQTGGCNNRQVHIWDSTVRLCKLRLRASLNFHQLRKPSEGLNVIYCLISYVVFNFHRLDLFLCLQHTDLLGPKCLDCTLSIQDTMKSCLFL